MMRIGTWSLALGLALLALAACGSASIQYPSATSITSAQVERTGASPQNTLPPFEAFITDAAKAQALYTAVLALPPYPSGSRSCPIDFGITYHVAFFINNQEVVDAAIDPNGCGPVVLSKPSASATDIRWWAQSDGFWSTVAASLGVPERAIYPVVPSATPTQMPG